MAQTPIHDTYGKMLYRESVVNPATGRGPEETQGYHAGHLAIDTQTRGGFISRNSTVTTELINSTRNARMLISAIDGYVQTASKFTDSFRHVTSSPALGNYVTIQGSGNHSHLTLTYAHLHEILVSQGEPVTAGTVIGTEGDTGRSDGQHLHFAAQNNGVTFDPRQWLTSQNAPNPGEIPEGGSGATPEHPLQSGGLLTNSYSYPYGPTNMCGIYSNPTYINYGYAVVSGSADWQKYGGEHLGCDSTHSGDNTLHSPISGTVIEAYGGGGYNGGWGNTVVLKISGNEWIRFAHMESIAVGLGDELNAGDVVGVEGTTGRSTGVHLHFEYGNTHRLSNYSVGRSVPGMSGWAEDPFTWLTGIQSHESPWLDGWQDYVTPPSGGDYSGEYEEHVELPPELYLLLPNMSSRTIEDLKVLLLYRPDLIKGVLLRTNDTDGNQHQVRTITLDNDVALGATVEMTNESHERQAHRIARQYEFKPLPFGIFVRNSKPETYEMFMRYLRKYGFIRQGYITGNSARNTVVRSIEPEERRPIVAFISPENDLADRLQEEIAGNGMVRQDTVWSGLDEVDPKPPLVVLQGGVTTGGVLTSSSAVAGTMVFECAIAAVSENQVIVSTGTPPGNDDPEWEDGEGTGEPGMFVDIPEGMGIKWTNMSYFCNGMASEQRKFVEHAIANGRFRAADIPSGNAKMIMVDDRYVIATRPNIGNILPVTIGDYLNVTFTPTGGTAKTIKCICGEWKGADANSIYGHDGGKCVTEYLHNGPAWTAASTNLPFGDGKVNRIAKVGNYGSYR